MKTRKLTEVPQSEFSKETNFIVEIDEELKRVRSSDIRQLVSDEKSRAEGAEQVLSNRLIAETARATGAEEELSKELSEEAVRAQAAEKANADAIQAEGERAQAKEAEIEADLFGEISRAKAAETANTDAIETEAARAGAAERVLTENLAAETARAEAAEKTLTDDLTSEVARAKAAEKTLTDNLAAETARAEAKEAELQGSIQTEKARAEDAEASIRNTISTNKPVWDDKYTRNEVDNKLSALETKIDWKESVATFADIAKTYPNPVDGWTVNVKDTDYTYRYSGTAWVAISANAIPKATQSVDGLLTKEDKTAYDDANVKKHTHSNKSVIDKITQSLLDNWTAAFTHISDTVKHITVAERTAWNDANSKKHTHSNKSVIDKITQAMLDKLAGIATGAEVNVQSDWNTTDTASDAYIKNKPSSMPASDVAAWAKAAGKPSYSWSEIGSKPSAYPPSSHTHTKSQISDMPTKVSQFSNDVGYITAADVDTSQNHTHSNKGILDKITQALLDQLSSAYSHINNKSNPHEVTAAQAGAAAVGHTHTKDQISDFPTALPANGGTARYLSANYINANVDLNSITTLGIYCCTLDSTAAGLKNCPTTRAFLLMVGRHAGVYQRVTEYVTKNPRTFERNYYSGTWGAWRDITVLTSVPAEAKFTDTVYVHPNSGAAAGTYRSVTVNAQGHVTAGSNPTTLEGYGITDAATKTEVNGLKKSVADGKSLVAGAISAKGVSTAATTTFAAMAENIGKIQWAKSCGAATLIYSTPNIIIYDYYASLVLDVDIGDRQNMLAEVYINSGSGNSVCSFLVIMNRDSTVYATAPLVNGGTFDAGVERSGTNVKMSASVSNDRLQLSISEVYFFLYLETSARIG